MTTGLLIRGAMILDPWVPVRREDIRIADHRIVEMGEALRLDGEKEIDAQGMIATPGLINAHTHSGQSLARGTAPNLPLDLWMVWSIHGGMEQTAEDAYTTAISGALEMLLTGCTSVLDQVYIPPDDFEEHATAVMTAYADVGIRAAVAPMVQDRDFLESLALEPEVDQNEPRHLSADHDPLRLVERLTRFLDWWQGKNERLIPMLGPTAPQRCSDEFLRLVVELAGRRRVRIHTHLLETKTQRIAGFRRYGRSIVDHLQASGYLTPRTSFAHAVWLTPAEYETVRKSGSILVHNPVSNMRCGSGVMPLQYLLRQHVPVALGSDGAASNDSQNMFEVLKVASLLHTLYGDFRHWPQPVDIWRACLLNGASAVGRPIGQIRPGFDADLVLLSLDRHVVAPRDHLIASLVNSDHGVSVDTVVVGGQVVAQERASVRVDEWSVRSRARAWMERSVASLERRRSIYAGFEEEIAGSIDRAAADPLEPTRWWSSRVR